MHIQKYRRNEFVPLMIELVRLYQPKVYVEIGAGEGYTFNQIATCSTCIEKAVAVDIKPMKGVLKLGNVELWQMSSQDFAKKWKGPIDLLFIDGDHNKEVVEHDFDEIGKHVQEGTGLILMHDTHPMTEELLKPEFCHDAWQFADWLHSVYLRWPDYSEVLTLPGPWAGMTIVRKRGENHLCWRN
jgi:predicted O-methyltransferase YrrM